MARFHKDTQHTHRTPDMPQPLDSDFVAVGWEAAGDWKEIKQIPPLFGGTRCWERPVFFTGG